MTRTHFDTLKFVAHGCTFIPLGTAAAIKTTLQGPATTAVIKGKVAMMLSSGENLIVNAGSSGSLDNAGKLITAKLTQNEMTALQNWSGVKPELVAEETAPVKAATAPVQASASSAATSTQPATTATTTAAASTPPPTTTTTTTSTAPAQGPTATTTAPVTALPDFRTCRQWKRPEWREWPLKAPV